MPTTCLQTLLVTPITHLIQPSLSVDESVSVKQACPTYQQSRAQKRDMYVTSKGVLKGCITEINLTRAILNKQETKPVLVIAETKLVAIKQDAELWQLLKILNGDNQQRKLLDDIPVVRENNILVGSISRDHLRTALSAYQIQEV